MFSVIIPLYNKEISIINTIQSVLDQTFQDFEIVVVNDGSTDKSVERVKAFDDPRIRIIDKPNGGVSSARNRGIEEAKYEWIAFLDGDDLWKVDHLSTLKEMIDIYPTDSVFTTSFVFSNNENTINNESKIERIEDFCKESMKHFNKAIIWTSVVCFKSQVIEDVGGFNTSYIRGEDIDLWIRMSQKYDIIYNHKVTAIYRIEAENRSDVNFVSIKETFLADIKFKNIDNKYEREYYKYFIINRIKSAILNKKWQELFYIICKYNKNIF